MSEPLHILLIEDDTALAMGTEYSLQDEGICYSFSENVASSKELLTTLKTAKLIVLFASCFIGLISFVQIFNTVCASMTLRKQELQTYEAIGMTKTQKRKMILLENGVVVTVTILVGILVSYGFSWYIVENLLNQDGAIHFIFPFVKVLGVSVVMFLGTCVVSMLGMGNRK